MQRFSSVFFLLSGGMEVFRPCLYCSAEIMKSCCEVLITLIPSKSVPDKVREDFTEDCSPCTMYNRKTFPSPFPRNFPQTWMRLCKAWKAWRLGGWGVGEIFVRVGGAKECWSVCRRGRRWIVSPIRGCRLKVALRAVRWVCYFRGGGSGCGFLD